MLTILVSIHQYQLSTFFLVISHIPVKAEALARASAQGITPSKKNFLKLAQDMAPYNVETVLLIPTNKQSRRLRQQRQH